MSWRNSSIASPIRQLSAMKVLARTSERILLILGLAKQPNTGGWGWELESLQFTCLGLVSLANRSPTSGAGFDLAVLRRSAHHTTRCGEFVPTAPAGDEGADS